jgi:hypothetical protein
MKKLFVFAVVFLLLQDILIYRNVSYLFNEYLNKVLYIQNIPKQQNYIVIDLEDCRSCVKTFITRIEKNYKKYKNTSIIFVGKDSDNNKQLTKNMCNKKNVYFDYGCLIRKLDLTNFRCVYIVIKDNKISNTIILTIENSTKYL